MIIRPFNSPPELWDILFYRSPFNGCTFSVMRLEHIMEPFLTLLVPVCQLHLQIYPHQGRVPNDKILNGQMMTVHSSTLNHISTILQFRAPAIGFIQLINTNHNATNHSNLLHNICGPISLMSLASGCVRDSNSDSSGAAGQQSVVRSCWHKRSLGKRQGQNRSDWCNTLEGIAPKPPILWSRQSRPVQIAQSRIQAICLIE